MTNLASWLSPSAMHSLGWTLLHFLWQGTALAALAAVLMSLCRQASSRYAVAVGVLVLMLFAPVATFFFLLPSDEAPSRTDAMVAKQAPAKASAGVTVAASAGLSRLSAVDTFPWLVEAWLLGVALLSLRSAGGFLFLERERRKRSTIPTDRVLAMCRTLQRQLGLKRVIHYRECGWLQVPAVIGWFRPIVLLPVTALTGFSEEQLQSVIAHELAHIQRLDPFVNLFQIAVETLLFYHPAVWWLNKRIRAQREHCCDDVAVLVCGNPVEYARALTMMEEWRSAPILAMAATRGPLTERIFRLLGRKSMASETRGIGLTGGLLCLTAALFAGNALLSVAYPKPTVHASEIRFARPAASPSPQSSQAQARDSAPTSAAKPSPAQPATAAKDEQQPASGNTLSYIDSMKAAGLANLTVEQLIALKIQDVTPGYVRGMHEQGLQPDAEKLIAMRIQGATAEYVHDLRGLDLNPDADQVVSLKIQGVDAPYIRGLNEAGIRPSIDELIALKIQDVTPEYLRSLHAQGLQPDVEHLLSLRIQGVTPEYVRDIRALGIAPNVDEFVSMRIQDVTPEYIKALKAAGFTFNVDDIIAAKIQDITPEFIENARRHGFEHLTLQKLIQLKIIGILDTRGEI